MGKENDLNYTEGVNKAQANQAYDRLRLALNESSMCVTKNVMKRFKKT